MLHILFLTHWYPSSRNPVEGIFIQEHARAVSIHHKVTVIHVIGVDQISTEEITEESDPPYNIAVYHVRYAKPTLPKTSWLKRLQSVERIYNRLRSGSHPPDLIHAHIYSSADLAVYLGQKYHLPTALSEHASIYPRNQFTRSQALKARFFLNQIDLIMPVCKTLQSHMQRYGVRGPYAIVPNAVDASIFYPATNRHPRNQGDCQVLQVAYLNENKAVHNLIQAVLILREQFSALRVNIIGEGPERANLENLTRQLGVTEQVNFAGLQTKAQVAGWMRASDCLVLTSGWENQPVAVLEALACGLPVVATNVGGIPEIVNPQNGVLVPPDDPGSLAEGIKRALTEVFQADEISKQALKQYGYLAIASRFDDCYLRLLGTSRP
jgi:glycosyltransferase involved in cell wall biosynthesis